MESVCVLRLGLRCLICFYEIISTCFYEMFYRHFLSLNVLKNRFFFVYFNRIANLWNNIPNEIDVRQAESIDSFKRKLKSFYFKRLFNVGDNFRPFKIICPKCRRVNTLVA